MALERLEARARRRIPDLDGLIRSMPMRGACRRARRRPTGPSHHGPRASGGMKSNHLA